MNKYTFAVALLGLIHFNSPAEQIEVSVSTIGLTEHQVREKVKLEARWYSVKNLPVLISGNEKINSTGEYSREVTALSAAALNITVLNEYWDNEAGTLTSKLEVTQNTDISEHVFGSLLKNDTLKKQLRKAYENLDKVLKVNSEYDFTTASSDMGMLDTVYNVLYMRNSYQESMRVKSLLQNDYESYVLNKYITPYFNSLEPIAIDVDEKGLVIKYGSHFYEKLSKSCMSLVNAFFFQNTSSTNKVSSDTCIDEPIFNQLDLSYKKKWYAYASDYKDGEIVIIYPIKYYGSQELTRIMNDPVNELRKIVVISYKEDNKVRW